MDRFSGSGRDSFTIANGFIQTAGGYGFPKAQTPTLIKLVQITNEPRADVQ
jgi:hypothetical protein